MEALCLGPIDVVKTRLQLDSTKQYSGILNCGTTIIKNEGIGALWKGCIPFATHLYFKYALRMGSNSTYQNLMRDERGHLNDYRCSPPKWMRCFGGVPALPVQLMQSNVLVATWR
jgi:hypothetical protein